MTKFEALVLKSLWFLLVSKYGWDETARMPSSRRHDWEYRNGVEARQFARDLKEEIDAG